MAQRPLNTVQNKTLLININKRNNFVGNIIVLILLYDNFDVGLLFSMTFSMIFREFRRLIQIRTRRSCD